MGHLLEFCEGAEAEKNRIMSQANSFYHPSAVGKWVPALYSWEGKGRYGSFRLRMNERVGVRVKLWDPLRTHAIPERFCSSDSLRRGAISSVCTFTFTLLKCQRTCAYVHSFRLNTGTVPREGRNCYSNIALRVHSVMLTRDKNCRQPVLRER